MKLILLAAGEGKRFYPLSLKLDKIMMPFLGKPLLAHFVDSAKAVGIDEVIIVASPRNFNTLKDYFKDGSEFEITIKYVVQEERKGPAHAIYCAKEFFKDEDFILVKYGDTLNFPDSIKLITNSLKKDCSAKVLLKEVDDPSHYGVVRFEDDKIVELVEKPKREEAPSRLALQGTFILRSKDFISGFEEKGLSEKEVPPPVYVFGKGIVDYKIINTSRINLSKPSDVIGASLSFLNLITNKNINPAAKISKDAIIDGLVIVQEGAEIKRGAKIIGPAHIGKRAVIGKNSLVVFSDIEEGAVINKNLRINNSYVFKDTVVTQNLNNDLKHNIKIIIFDADHTLYFPHPSRAYEEKFNFLSNKTDLSKADLRDIWNEVLIEILNSGTQSVLERSREYSVKRALERAGINDFDTLSQKAVAVFWKQVAKDLEPTHGVLDVVNTLKRKGYVLIVASDEFRSSLDIKLSKVFGEWKKIFSSSVSSEDVGVLKPSRLYYDIVLRKFNAHPDQLIMVGDSWKRDLEPAKTLGIKTILFNKEHSGEPDYYIRDLKELLRLNL